MVRKKLDERIRTLFQHCITTNQRALLLLVGDHGKDQVPNLYQIMERTADMSKSDRLAKEDIGSKDGNTSVLWCYKKELGFSTHRKKRMEKLKRDKKRGLSKLAKGGASAATTNAVNAANEEMDNFELFLTTTTLTWCYYKDSHRVLGTTHSVLVLQDFEALTPNILARTIETVRGGGMIIFLLRTVKSLKQLYAMSMDVHSRYRTEGSGEVVPRFNERFILSLGGCGNCLVCDDELNILPVSRRSVGRLDRMMVEMKSGKSHKSKKSKRGRDQDGDDSDEEEDFGGSGGSGGPMVISHKTPDEIQLDQLKETLRDTPHVGKLVELTKTLDQARAVLTFLEACADHRSNNTNNTNNTHSNSNTSNDAKTPYKLPLSNQSTTSTTISLTAPRGRGKSAAMGLCLAGAISFQFTSICVTAPEPENLVAVFQFLIRGLRALKYVEHLDYRIGYNYDDGGGNNSSSYGGGGNYSGGGGGEVKGEKAGRDNTKCIISVEIHRGSHRQIVRYVRPRDVENFVGAELVAIDEAAAIPLPVVRGLLRLNGGRGGKQGANGVKGSKISNSIGEERRLTFLSSTINGYEGTGRALSLKLIKELRDLNFHGMSSNTRAIEAAREAGAAIAGAKSHKGEAKVHEQRWAAESLAAKGAAAANAANGGGGGGGSSSGGPLKELDLSHPIRYALGDPVEAWLNQLLCLDCDSFDYNNTLRTTTNNNNNNNGANHPINSHIFAPPTLKGIAPAPSECELYHVNRDALFSYHRLSESFLQKLWGLYTSAHYKNTPNDLQMLSDAPAHSVFVLLGPTAEDDTGNDHSEDADRTDQTNSTDQLPDILAIVQTTLEGRLSQKTIQAQLSRGHRSAGDLIPWTMSQQFGDKNFAQLSGARVVRVAVHPGVQGMGYGGRAMELLWRYYNGEMVGLDGAESESDESGGSSEESDNDNGSTPSESDDDNDNGRNSSNKPLLHKESLKPRTKLPPLLLPLSSLPTPRLDWIGTSFGLTPQLYNFWSRHVGMTLLYLRQTCNELTGEHSTIMIRALPRRSGWDDAWLPAFGVDARRRVGRLLGGAFRGMEVGLAVRLMSGDCVAGYGHLLNGDGDGNGGEEDGNDDGNDDNDEDGDNKKKEMDQTALVEVKKRSGTQSTKLTSTELHYHLTPHDLQRLELYGRNLCDHHLISDLIPSLSQLYFTNRLGNNFRLSSVQSALLCGMGLQFKSVDELTQELNLPSNQVLAMFNKAVKKMSMHFHQLLVQEESDKLLSKEAVKRAEVKSKRVRDVVGQSLEEDVGEGAVVAMGKLKEGQQQEEAMEEKRKKKEEKAKSGKSEKSGKKVNSGVTGTRMTPEINDPEILKYALKGTDEEWAQALDGNDGEKLTGGATIQIKSTKEVKKRKAEGDVVDVVDGLLQGEGSSSVKKDKGKKKSRKSSGGKKGRKSQ